jgi:pimeloyl-ACP methyl ester carboxylesterase
MTIPGPCARKVALPKTRRQRMVETVGDGPRVTSISIRRRCWRLLLAPVVWLAMCAPAWAEPAVGDWTGVLRPPGMLMRLNIHLSTAPDGALTGYLVSLDQGDANLPLDRVAASDETLLFSSSKVRASYEGHWNAALRMWEGQWIQSGASLPLNLRRGVTDLPVRAPRPQRPAEPFPYTEQEVRFDSPGAHLAGTLSLPRGKGPFPVVLLIAGSGLHTRNESILGHQPFLVISDYLTRRGVAVLRYDKRGTGGSLGDYQNATTVDFADDARAAVAFLRARADIDPRRVGLVGHSEGGLIAPMIAAGDPRIAFVVLLAGPGVDGKQILLEQDRLIRIANGGDPATVQEGVEGNRRLFDLILSGATPEQVRAASPPRPSVAPDEPPPLSNQFQWMHFFLGYDPVPALRSLKIPVLAMNGSKDLQVPPAQNLPPIRAALADNPKAQVVELPGLNHLFQTAGTGSPSEYGDIEETFAPEALKVMGDFVLAQAGRAPAQAAR